MVSSRVLGMLLTTQECSPKNISHLPRNIFHQRFLGDSWEILGRLDTLSLARLLAMVKVSGMVWILCDMVTSKVLGYSHGFKQGSWDVFDYPFYKGLHFQDPLLATSSSLRSPSSKPCLYLQTMTVTSNHVSIFWKPWQYLQTITVSSNHDCIFKPCLHLLETMLKTMTVSFANHDSIFKPWKYLLQTRL